MTPEDPYVEWPLTVAGQRLRIGDYSLEVLQVTDNAVKTVLAQEHVRKRLADVGMAPYYAGGAELGRQIASEGALWADVIKKAGITFE